MSPCFGAIVELINWTKDQLKQNLGENVCGWVTGGEERRLGTRHMLGCTCREDGTGCDYSGPSTLSWVRLSINERCLNSCIAQASKLLNSHPRHLVLVPTLWQAGRVAQDRLAAPGPCMHRCALGQNTERIGAHSVAIETKLGV